jgi:hypothetical protein
MFIVTVTKAVHSFSCGYHSLIVVVLDLFSTPVPAGLNKVVCFFRILEGIFKTPFTAEDDSVSLCLCTLIFLKTCH